VKLVGKIAEWVGRGAGPRTVERIIVETDRVLDIASEVAQRIRESISPLPLLRSIIPRFTGPTGLPIAGIGIRDILMRAGDILSSFLSVKIVERFNLVSFPATAPMVEELESDRRVKKIYPDRIMWTLQYPIVPRQGIYKDKVTGELFTSTEWTRKLIGAERANLEGYTGRGIKVAVIDTTATPTHRAISHAIGRTTIRGLYSDENGHGVWCASCIGGKPYVDPVYNIPTQGIAPDCQLFTIKALGFVIGFGNESDIIEAMDLAARLGCKIISMSLGSEEVPENPEDDPQSRIVETLTKENNVIIVCAAGNSGPNPRTINSPGIAESAITVGAYNPITGEVASYSSRGPTPDGRIKPDVIMPGSNIFAPTVGLLDGLSPPKGAARASTLSGTSMSTPHCSGLVALMCQHAGQHNIDLGADDVKSVMRLYGDEREKSTAAGWGILTWSKWVSFAREHLGI